MAQFGYPTSDITAGNWTNVGGPTTHYECLDEVSYSDSDYCQLNNYSSDTFEVRLNTLTDPVSSSNHVVHLRVQKVGTGTINLTCYLVQNTTVLVTQSLTLTTSWADVSFTLTGAQADSITDYTNLRLRFTGTAGSSTRYVRVSWANLEVPNGPAITSKSAYMRGAVVARYTAGFADFPSITILDNFNRASLGSQWVVNAGSPSIYNNSVLNLAGADIQYASGVSWPVEFFMTISGFPTDPQFYQVYLDYNLHNGTGSTKTTYRYSFGFIHNDGALNGVELQKSVNDGAFTSIITTGAYTWPNGTPSVKFGLRHLDNGDIYIYLNKGSGWELTKTGNDSSIIASGWWRLQGGTDTGNEYFDDFALGHPQLGNGGRPAYVRGGTAATPTVRHAYINGKTAGTSVTTSKSAYTKGRASSTYSKSAFVLGLDNRYYPSIDISASGVWRNELKGTTNLYQSIDEPLPANDNDYIYPDILFTGNYYECKLGNPLSTPGSGAVVLFWRGNDQTGLGSKAKVELRQGITVLASGQQILTSVPTTYYIQLTPAQRTNISDWSDLRVRIIVAS